MRLRRDRLKLTTTLRDTLSAQRDALTGRPLRYRSQAIKNYAAICRMRRDRSLTSQTAFGGQLTYKGSLVRPVVRFHHSLSEYNGRLLRITSHGFFPRTQMRRFAATDSNGQRRFGKPSARSGTPFGRPLRMLRFAATDSILYYDRVPSAINSGYA